MNNTEKDALETLCEKHPDWFKDTKASTVSEEIQAKIDADSLKHPMDMERLREEEIWARVANKIVGHEQF